MLMVSARMMVRSDRQDRTVVHQRRHRHGWIELLLCQANGMSHTLSSLFHSFERVRIIIHSCTHGSEPPLEKSASPLYAPLVAPEGEDSGDIIWVILLVTDELQSNSPGPAHPDQDQARRFVDSVQFHIVGLHSVFVDWIVEVSVLAGATRENDH